jgi:hypothetical protein
VHKKVVVKKEAVAKPKSKPAPPKEQFAPLLAAGTPTAASPSSFSSALLIVAFGVALALLAFGLSRVPASVVPAALGLRLERSRQTILLVGLAIGVACALVALLTVLVGR